MFFSECFTINLSVSLVLTLRNKFLWLRKTRALLRLEKWWGSIIEHLLRLWIIHLILRRSISTHILIKFFTTCTMWSYWMTQLIIMIRWILYLVIAIIPMEIILWLSHCIERHWFRRVLWVEIANCCLCHIGICLLIYYNHLPFFIIYFFFLTFPTFYFK